MNIKEIAQALKLNMQDPDDGRFDIGEFAEALIAEIAKQNKPVMVLFQHKDTGRTTSIEPQSASDFGRINKRWINCGPLFSIPPTAEQIANETAWQPIETAPKDKRCIVWSGQEMYCARWSQNPFTGDEAWVVAEWGSEGDQAIVKPTHWLPLPEAPKGE
jgi:hypothetical protein